MRKYFWWLLTLTWAALIWHLTTVPDFHPSDSTLISLLLSNGGHFIFFGAQAIWLHLSGLTRINAILLTANYGLFIEIVQSRIPGRSYSLVDWSLDILGALTFLFLLKRLKFTHNL